MNVVLLGLPGSGKGTQAELISKEFNLYYFQTGEFSRKLALKNLRIRKIVEKGELIPEKEMTKYVLEYLDEELPQGKNILFEGFPRFVSQFENLEGWLKIRGQKVDKVLFLNLSEEEVIRRLSSRRICKICGKVYNLITNPPKGKNCECGGGLEQRSDDNIKSIKIRLKYYRENTGVLVNYLERLGRLAKINAERPILEIFEDIKKNLKTNNEK